jgi:hypothetical protein
MCECACVAGEGSVTAFSGGGASTGPSPLTAPSAPTALAPRPQLMLLPTATLADFHHQRSEIIDDGDHDDDGGGGVSHPQARRARALHSVAASALANHWQSGEGLGGQRHRASPPRGPGVDASGGVVPGPSFSVSSLSTTPLDTGVVAVHRVRRRSLGSTASEADAVERGNLSGQWSKKSPLPQAQPAKPLHSHLRRHDRDDAVSADDPHVVGTTATRSRTASAAAWSQRSQAVNPPRCVLDGCDWDHDGPNPGAASRWAVFVCCCGTCGSTRALPLHGFLSAVRVARGNGTSTRDTSGSRRRQTGMPHGGTLTVAWHRGM